MKARRFILFLFVLVISLSCADQKDDNWKLVLTLHDGRIIEHDVTPVNLSDEFIEFYHLHKLENGNETHARLKALWMNSKTDWYSGQFLIWSDDSVSGLYSANIEHKKDGCYTGSLKNLRFERPDRHIEISKVDVKCTPD